MNMFEFRERANSGVDDATEDLATAVIGAAVEVHRLLKPGMPENAYKLALCHELKLRGIPFECEVRVPILYKGVLVGEGFVDVLVDKRLVLELKAVEALSVAHRGQTVGYLQGLALKLGLLINFNVAQLRSGIKRVVNTYHDLRD